jgi:hypothetical protein
MEKQAVCTALEAHKAVEKFAQKSSDKLREIPEKLMKVGKAIRQGDLYVKRIESFDEKSQDVVEYKDNQLVPGSTMGSRHIVRGNVKCFKKLNSDQFTGPVIVAKERFLIEHPLHAHCSLPAGIYQTTYQVDFSTQQRAKD